MFAKKKKKRCSSRRQCCNCLLRRKAFIKQGINKLFKLLFFFVDLQPAGGVSQITFGSEESASPKKPVTIPEVAKQRELSGTRETTDDIHARRGSFSNAKAKELTGSNIFGPPPPDQPKNNRSFEMREESKTNQDQPQPRSLHTSVRISNVSVKESHALA